MYYAKVRCADTFKNRQLQFPARLTSAPSLLSVLLCRRRQKRQNKDEISELQVELDGPKILLEDERQVVQRKVTGPPIDRKHTHM